MGKKVTINPNIFRAYDIRGKAMLDNGSTKPDKVDLSPESVYLITCGIATYMRRKFDIPHNKMMHTVVGRDTRLTSPGLLDAMVLALCDSNCKVANIDLATPPLVYYPVCKCGFNMGLVITASHNHKNDNGIKIVGAAPHPRCGPGIQKNFKIFQK